MVVCCNVVFCRNNTDNSFPHHGTINIQLFSFCPRWSMSSMHFMQTLSRSQNKLIYKLSEVKKMNNLQMATILYLFSSFCILQTIAFSQYSTRLIIKDLRYKLKKKIIKPWSVYDYRKSKTCFLCFSPCSRDCICRCYASTAFIAAL